MCEEGGRGGGEGVNIVTITEKEVGQLNSYPPAILEGITKQHSCMTNDATSAYLPLCVYHHPPTLFTTKGGMFGDAITQTV